MIADVHGSVVTCICRDEGAESYNHSCVSSSLFILFYKAFLLGHFDINASSVQNRPGRVLCG